MSNILTLKMDSGAQGHFEALRQQYFPRERNHIPAHISLFHTLPSKSSGGQGIADALTDIAATQSPFSVTATGVRSLGRGVAYALASPALLLLHRRLSTIFADHLTPQDTQRFQPHIVVQNKVTPEQARRLLADLERGFHAMEFNACGLELWRYLGGPWQHLELYPFVPPPPLAG